MKFSISIFLFIQVLYFFVQKENKFLGGKKSAVFTMNGILSSLVSWYYSQLNLQDRKYFWGLNIVNLIKYFCLKSNEFEKNKDVINI